MSKSSSISLSLDKSTASTISTALSVLALFPNGIWQRRTKSSNRNRRYRVLSYFHLDVSSFLMFVLGKASCVFLALSLRPFAKKISQTPRPQSAGLNRWLQRFSLPASTMPTSQDGTNFFDSAFFPLGPPTSLVLLISPCIPRQRKWKQWTEMNRMQKCRSFVWSKAKSTNHGSEISEFRFPQRAFKTLPWGSKLGVSVQRLWLNDKSLSCHWPCSKSVKP